MYQNGTTAKKKQKTIIYFGQRFIEEIHKEIVQRKTIKNYTELKQYIKSWAMYHYWSKCEHEILVGGLFSNWDKYGKIDAYRQIEMNLDRITEYVIKELKIDF